MASRTETLVFKLGKVMAAVAWSDGELHTDELNALKDVLADLPELSGREWARLRMYLDTPVDAEEADALVADLLSVIRSEADKAMAIGALERLVEADERTTSEEREALERIREAVEERQVGLGGLLAGFTRILGAHRADAPGAAGTREEHFDTYLRNPVLFDMIRGRIADSLGEEEREKLAACAAIMGRVAFQDEDISDSEKQCIAGVVAESWQLGAEDARRLVDCVAARTSRATDYHRLTYDLVENTTREERLELAKTLFAVANACDKTSHEEIERIRGICKSLRLDHKGFIAAKLTISREDRWGL